MATLMRVFAAEHYSGTISSEWEGSMWAPDADGFAIIKAHQEMVRRHFDAGSEIV